MGPQLRIDPGVRRRKLALLLAAIVGVVGLGAGASPAFATRANGVCGGTEIPPGSNNC
jgi:hypothetical protein